MTSSRAASRRGHFLALDRKSVRTKDADGHLHISATPISKANVCGYAGREIPGWEDLGLHADRVYNLYRDPEELARAADSFSGKQLMFGHVPVNAGDHAPDKWIGSVTGVEWKPPYLMARLDIVAQDAIDAIESGEHEELSSGYEYRPDMTPGRTPDGEKYDGVMRDIRGNHVAIVPEGRAGPDVRAMDEKRRPAVQPRLKDLLMARQTTEARKTIAKDALMRSALRVGLLGLARGQMVQDAKLDMDAVLKGVTSANAKSKAKGVAKAFDAAIRPKLATDADVDAETAQSVVEEIVDLIDSSKEDIASSVADPEPAVDPDGTDAPDMSALMSFLAGKLSDEDMDKVKSMMGKSDEDDAEDGKRRNRTTASPAQDKEKDMVPKAAMDAALAQTRREAAEEGAKMARDHAAAVREAERICRPYAGDVIATDSAEAVYRAALDVLEVDHKDRPAGVLRDLVEVYGKAKQDKAAPSRFATDAAPPAKIAYDTTKFPDSSRLK